jgi:hypothetical protein
MFNGDEHKPISIIITTLAAKAYDKEEDIIEALIKIVNKMPDLIDEYYCHKTWRWVKKVANPVNEEENFADKWVDYPNRQQNFYAWLDQVKKDLENMVTRTGLHNIEESMSQSFGEKTVKRAFSTYAEHNRLIRESGYMKMALKTGTLGTVGNTVKNHDFHGKKD